MQPGRTTPGVDRRRRVGGGSRRKPDLASAPRALGTYSHGRHHEVMRTGVWLSGVAAAFGFIVGIAAAAGGDSWLLGPGARPLGSGFLCGGWEHSIVCGVW